MKSGTIHFKPQFLPTAVGRIAVPNRYYAHSIGGTLSIDIAKEFLVDAAAMKEDAFLEKWSKRWKDVRQLIAELATRPDNSSIGLHRPSLLPVLIMYLEQSWKDTYLWRLLGLCFANPDSKLAWDLLESRLRTYGGSRPYLQLVASNIGKLKDVTEFATSTLEVNGSLHVTIDSYQFHNSEYEQHFVVAIIAQACLLGKIKAYREELLGSSGLLERVSRERFAVFLNLYVGDTSDVHTNDDPFMHYIRNAMGGFRNSSWAAPEITDRTRDNFRKWSLQKDLAIIFGEVFRDKERMNYWLSWLSSIRDLRVWHPLPKEVSRVIDAKVSKLNIPTVAMKIGNSIVFECAERGAGAVYVYPEDGPVPWDTVLTDTRDYKAPFLDNPHIREQKAWNRVIHVHGFWQSNLDQIFYRTYGITRTQ